MGQAHFELLTNFTSLTFSQRGERKPWRKILYERQPYADNYFDEALFLQGLRRNMNVVTYEYWDVVQDSSVVTLQMTTVAFFCSLFVHVKSEAIPVPLLYTLTAFFAVVGFLFWLRLTPDVTSERILTHFKSLLIVSAAVWLFSPILKTLTEPMSDDTLLAWTVFLFLIHLATQDYAYLSGLSEKFTAPFSLNAAIFASAIIVSRLPSVTHVVPIILIAIELFALFPILRRAVLSNSTQTHLVVTWALAFLTSLMLAPVSTSLAVIYVLGLLLATFVAPAWLIHIQQYKNTIHGPWDEAIPTRSRANWKG